MALPKNLPPRKEEIIDFLREAPLQSVAGFLRDNPAKMERFFKRKDKSFDLEEFLPVLHSNNPKIQKKCRAYIGECTDKFAHDIPTRGLKMPNAILKQRLKDDRRQILSDLATSAGKSLRGKIPSLLNLPVKGLALGLNLAGMSYAKRQAAGIGFSTPIIAASFAALAAGHVDEAQAALPPQTDRAPLQITVGGATPLENSGSVLAYNNAANPLNPADTFDIIISPRNPLLDFIARAEHVSGFINDSYDIGYGNINYDLTSKTINEVIALQGQLINDGTDSSAMGRYQILQSTLEEQVDKLGLTGNEMFDEQRQDQIALELLNKRGLQQYLHNGDLDSFILNLSKEWASLPKDSSGESYYDHDGLNASRTTYNELVHAVTSMRVWHADVASVTFGAIPTEGPTNG